MRHRGFVHDLWNTFVYEDKLNFESLHHIFSSQALTIDPLLGMHVGPEGIQAVCKGWHDSYANVNYPKVQLLDSGENYICFDWQMDNLLLPEDDATYSPVQRAGFDGTTLMEISENKVVSIQYQLKSMEKKRSIAEQLEITEQQKSAVLKALSSKEAVTHLEALVMSCYLTGRSYLYTERLLGVKRKVSQYMLDQKLSVLGLRTRKALFDHYTMRQSVHLFYRLFELQKNCLILERLLRAGEKRQRAKLLRR